MALVFEEKTVTTEKIFDGTVIKLRVDEVAMPDDKLAVREIVEHPGGVGIVAVNDKDEVILVRQFRKPIEKVIYEIPAGKLDSGEPHRECGIRELAEETGMRADTFEYLGFIYPSPGFADEVTHVYCATGLTQGSTNPDEDEYLDVEFVPFEKAYEMVLNNEINDAKSVFGILKVWQLRSSNK